MSIPIITAMYVDVTTLPGYVAPKIEANEETLPNNGAKKEKTKQVANQVDEALNPLTKSGKAAQEMAAAASKATSLNDAKITDATPKTSLLDKIANAFPKPPVKNPEIRNTIKLSGNINPNHPLSATHLFECYIGIAGGVCIDKGDVMNITTEMQKQITEGDFTYCSSFKLEKTRLSQDTFVQNGALFIGTRDSKLSDALLCHKFSEGAMIKEMNSPEFSKNTKSK